MKLKCYFLKLFMSYFNTFYCIFLLLISLLVENTFDSDFTDWLVFISLFLWISDLEFNLFKFALFISLLLRFSILLVLEFKSVLV